MADAPAIHETLAIAGLLERARIRALPIDPPGRIATLTLAEAYGVQDAVVALRIGRGAHQSGWKLGITSPVKQRVMGIEHPLFGRTFDDGAVQSGGGIDHDTLIAPRAEPELAFGLTGPIDPSMDQEALLRAVAWIASALEITSSRYASGTRTAQELIVDNTSSAAYVIGEHFAPESTGDIGKLTTELVHNGTVVRAGSTADVLGHPLRALAALAEHVRSRNLETQPGDIVLSGAITDAIPVSVGDTIEARIAGLGAVTITFT